MKNIVVLICGGTSSGKTTVAHFLYEYFWHKSVIVSQDSYYREYPKNTNFENINFDDPKSIDFDNMVKEVKKLQNGKAATGYLYNFGTFKREGKIKIEPRKIIFIEGIFTFFNEEIFALADLKIFIDASEKTRLTRRITRDISRYNRKIKDIEIRWRRDVQPSFEKYIKPYKGKADLLVKWEKFSSKEINKIEKAVQSLLEG